MLENLKLERVVVHEVLTAAEIHRKSPTHGDGLIKMDENGRQLICERLVECIGSTSHCEEMVVASEDASSPFQSVAGVLDELGRSFVSKTGALADRLSEAQSAGSIKAGLGVFLQGTGMHGGQKLRWLAIIKADPDKGFMSETKGTKITLRYVANMIMGAQQRLLKVAFFVELERQATRIHDPSNFSIKIYDHLLSNSGRGTSAFYFYSSFLGLKPAENSSKLCRIFYEKTLEFTDGISKTDAEKVQFRSHLISYLRSERRQISTKDFADNYLPDAWRNAYSREMKRGKFPTNAVVRDITLIKSRLRKQSLKFTSKIILVGSDDEIMKSVVFGDVVHEKGEEWTKLKIKGKLESSGYGKS